MKNPYFKYDPAEKTLMEDLITEAIEIHGYDVVYIPREKIVRDNLFGEDWLSKFDGGAAFVEMYIISFDGVQGGDVFSKFGIQKREKLQLMVSKKRFEKAMAHFVPELYRPREGDLIHILPFKQFFEITYVDNVPASHFLPGDRAYTYTITAEGYQYDSEIIQTDFTEVDNMVIHENDRLVYLNLSGICGSFTNNEIVYVGDTLSGSPFYGTIVNYDKNTPDLLQIRGHGGSAGAVIGQTITGIASGATGSVEADLGNTLSSIPTDPFASNDTLRTEGHTIIDFSEVDPFSEGNY